MKSNFRTLNLAKEFFETCQKIKATSVIKNQMDRAALSVYLNLVEGNANTSPT
jgi:four helix bundle protein